MNLNLDLNYLEIFLYVNVFIVGGLITLAIQHLRLHFKQKKDDERDRMNKHFKTDDHLPAMLREKLIQESEDKYQAVIDHSASDLEKDLQKISVKVDSKLEKLSNQIVDDETKRYQTDLDKMRKDAEQAIVSAQKEIADHQQKLKEELEKQQSELQTKMNEEVAAEKEKLVQQVDTKLADAVTSFLIETVGHNVDLGAQNKYMIEMLEEHKSELIKGIKDEA